MLGSEHQMENNSSGPKTEIDSSEFETDSESGELYMENDGDGY